MKKALFIINPRAGVDRVKAIKTTIEKNIDKSRFDYETVYTEYAQHGTILARQGAENGFDLVVAVGGDGSMNDVINGLYGTEAVLGIIPKGSGNGLSRSLQIPMRETEAIKLLNRWQIKEINIGEADGHLFASNAGVGFDALVTKKFSHSKHRGLMNYLAIIFKYLWSYPVKDWNIEIEGKPMKRNAFMLTVANAKQLGYGFQTAPQANMEDGYFDLITIRNFPKVMGGLIALRAFTGKIQKSRYVRSQKVQNIIISHPKLSLLQIDGEAKNCGSEINIKILPKKLKVLT